MYQHVHFSYLLKPCLDVLKRHTEVGVVSLPPSSPPYLPLALCQDGVSQTSALWEVGGEEPSAASVPKEGGGKRAYLGMHGISGLAKDLLTEVFLVA